MADLLDKTLLVLVQVVMLVGWIGEIVPGFPGLLLIWLAALGYGLVTAFNTVGIIAFLLISLLMLAGMALDNILVGIGARQGGATWLAIIVAVVAFIVGTVFFPPFGGIIAAPASVLLVEFLHAKDLRKAWLAVRGMAAGYGIAFVSRFGIGFLMMVVWWLWVRFG